MSKKACKCAEVECEECPEWIFTLADLIMCMMGLFVLLWVLKPPPGHADNPAANEDWIRVVAKIREAFDYLPDPKSNDPVDQYMLLQKLQQMKPLKGPGDGGQTHILRRGAEGSEPEVVSVRRGNQAITGGHVRFAAGRYDLDAEARKVLDQIAVQIKGYRNIIFVKGHTSLDELPEAGEQEKLDLSIRRAKAAADYLVSRGVEPEILRVLGCSTFEPVAQQAYTLERQQANRRVEVESTSTLVAGYQDRPEPAKPATIPTPGAGPGGP